MPRKFIKSADNKILLKFDDVKQVCICITPYALLQYFLINELDTCQQHTAYIFDESMNSSIKKKLPHIYFQNYFQKTFFNKIYRKCIRLYTALTRYIHYPFLKTAKIFAQDHRFFSLFIGNRPYSLLEDAPDVLSSVYRANSAVTLTRYKKSHSISGRLEQAIYGTPCIYTYGNNNQCSEFYLSKPIDSFVLEGKILHISSFQSMWEQSSSEKKKFILDIFDVTNEDMAILSQKPNIFFSQPLDSDFNINQDEYIKMLKSIFSKYDPSQLLIKVHPRDTFDYKHHFPNIYTYNKPINLQLLMLNGFSFKKAITICSSAVFELPEDIEVDWFGPSILPKTVIESGCLDAKLCPPRPYNQVCLN